MRTSKLLRVSFKTGLARKLLPFKTCPAAGYRPVSRTARGSCALRGITLDGRPAAYPKGTPHSQVGLPLVAGITGVWGGLKISPAEVACWLQSRVGDPLVNTWEVLSTRSEKSPDRQLVGG